jgi:hypothetical protein
MTSAPAPGLRELLDAAATEAGRHVDLDRVVRALEATARAFTRRTTAPEPPSVTIQRRRLRRLVAAADALESSLARLGRDGRASLDAWDTSADCAAWRAGLARLMARAEEVRDRAERPARRGGRRDEATRNLVLEVAWALHREGLPVTAYPGGLLAQTARAVATVAGRRLPDDPRSVERLLRVPVRFCAQRTGQESTSGDRFMPVTEAPSTPALSSQSDVAHRPEES